MVAMGPLHSTKNSNKAFEIGTNEIPEEVSRKSRTKLFNFPILIHPTPISRISGGKSNRTEFC